MKKLLLLISILLFQASFSQETITPSQKDSILKAASEAKQSATIALLAAASAKSYAESSRAIPTANPTFLDFVGTGDLQQTMASGGDLKATAGAGIIFERVYVDMSDGRDAETLMGKIEKVNIQSWDTELAINLASTSDSLKANVNDAGNITNTRDFGNFVMYPIGKKQSMYFNTNVYFGYKCTMKYIAGIISGLNLRMLTSNNTWTIGNNSINMGVLSLRAGIFHEFLPDNLRFTDEGRVKYSFFLGANFAYRGIVGDIRSVENEQFRKSILGTNRTDWRGVEFNMGFRLNNIRIEFQMPIFNYGAAVPGLTNTQFLYTIRYVGGFPLKLN